MTMFWLSFTTLTIIATAITGVGITVGATVKMTEDPPRWWHWPMFALGILTAITGVSAFIAFGDTHWT